MYTAFENSSAPVELGYMARNIRCEQTIDFSFLSPSHSHALCPHFSPHLKHSMFVRLFLQLSRSMCVRVAQDCCSRHQYKASACISCFPVQFSSVQRAIYALRKANMLSSPSPGNFLVSYDVQIVDDHIGIFDYVC